MQSEPFQAPTQATSPLAQATPAAQENATLTSPTAMSTTIPVEKSEPAADSSVPSPAYVGKTPSSSQPPSQPPPKAAKVESSFFGKKWFLALIGGVVLLIVGLLGWWLWNSELNPLSTPDQTTPVTGKVTLTYWGLWEESDIMTPLIEKYQGLHPEITINYQRQNQRQYRSRLQAAIRDGSGPDIFRFHNTWVPMMRDDLASAPGGTFTAQELKDEFYPVMAQDLSSGNQVYGVPLMYDGLALVYNQNLLETANATAPRDWKTLRDTAAALTIKNEARLERGGVALGTADNVDHFSDILALLILQNGTIPADPTVANVQTALEFYTIFSRLDGAWNATLPQSTLAFANEQVAMIFVPSWRIHEIRQLNPNLRFGVARMPQLTEDPITWATYWAEGVNKKSSHTKESWEFLTWLSQPEQLRQLYAQASKYRGFGELYPRVEMAGELSSDLTVAPYLEDALYAKSWYMADRTHDEGLNDQIIAYYKDAVNQMNDKGGAETALNAIAPGVKAVLSKFGVSVGR
jgi:multiple sugar transport system substrate-binding protein